MPLYIHECEPCGYTFTEIRPVAQFDKVTPCEKCGVESKRLIQSPMVMKESFPDGTKRFAKVREFRTIEREMKTEKDKGARQRMAAEQQKIIGGS
jgi:putative FmdB family regulatory protein